MTRKSGLLRGLFASERGNVLAMTAFSLPVMIGSAGLATDTVQWMLWQRQLQQQADASAIAGAYSYARGSAADGEEGAREALAIDTQENIQFDRSRTVIAPGMTNVVEDGERYDRKEVSVFLSGRRALPFSGLFMAEPPVIRASAKAGVVHSGDFCVITFGRKSGVGITATGDARIDLGCGMASNGNGAAAIDGKGNVDKKVITTNLMTVGQIGGSEKFTASDVVQNGIPQPDPFADKTGAKPSPCASQTLPKRETVTPLQPGCFSDFDLGNGTYDLAPGTYYVDGDLKVNAQATLRGTGVTFVLAPTATVSIEGGATINLTAPETGEYANIVLFQRRQDGVTAPRSKINGGSSFHLTGAVYIPNGALEFNGGASADSNCVLLIADSVDFSGNADWRNRCSGGGDPVKGLQVRLLS